VHGEALRTSSTSTYYETSDRDLAMRMRAEEDFSLSWDPLIKGMTAGVVVLVFMLAAIFGLVLDYSSLAIGLPLIFFSILIIPLLWAPQRYLVKDNIVMVRRRIGDAKICVSREPERWKWTWWGLRLFGSGGLYGYFGYFYMKRIGRVRMYATNRHNMVLLIDEKGEKMLVSPNEPDRFIRQLKESVLQKTDD
jgi:hypothetical protein